MSRERRLFATGVLAAGVLLATPASGADNGRALTPPRGWRSWNQYQADVDQGLLMDAIATFTDRSRTVDGTPTSLADLGFTDIGIDDAWQLCGSYGPNGYTYHDEHGAPVVDTSRFPSFATVNAVAHAANLTTGFYSNNCKCKDHCSDVACFAGDVDATLAMGFDSIKLDGCGKEENVELWYNMFEWAVSANGGKTAGGQPGMLVENCHNGPNVPLRDANGDLWAPFHMYRSSTDIRPVHASIVLNLLSVPPLAALNLSLPGVWAYPDMLEVGVTNGQSGPVLSLTQAQSHFSAWCIVSAPLILGFNVTDTVNIDRVWPIISNKEALAINSDYAGFSGTVFATNETQIAYAPCGWWIANCTVPAALWLYKPLSNGDTAVLMMNNDVVPGALAVQWSQVPGLTAGATYALRDVTNHVDLGSFASGYTATAVPAQGSVFLRLSHA